MERGCPLSAGPSQWVAQDCGHSGSDCFPSLGLAGLQLCGVQLSPLARAIMSLKAPQTRMQTLASLLVSVALFPHNI